MQSSKRRGWKTAFINFYWAYITNLESEKYLKNINFWLCSCERSRKSVLDKILELEMQTNQAAEWADTYSSKVTPTYRTSSQIGLIKSSKRLNFKQAKKKNTVSWQSFAKVHFYFQNLMTVMRFRISMTNILKSALSIVPIWLFFFRRVPRRNPAGKSLLNANPKSGGVPAGFEWKVLVNQFALVYKSDVV